MISQTREINMTLDAMEATSSGSQGADIPSHFDRQLQSEMVADLQDVINTLGHTEAILELEQELQESQQTLGPNASYLADDSHDPANLAHDGLWQIKTAKGIDDQIDTIREIIEITTPPGHPDRVEWLISLGTCLYRRFQHSGVMPDLEEAIETTQEALDATPPGSSHRPGLIHNLRSYLCDKFSITGTMSDLEQAIHTARGALDTTPPDLADRAMLLNNFGALLIERYSRLEETPDLELAIQVAQEAVDATPNTSPQMAVRLDNLRSHLSLRYEQTNSVPHLNKAIEAAQKVLEVTPLNDPNLATRLSRLGALLGQRYDRVDAEEDLENAIRLERNALEITGPNHPDRARLLNSLGEHLNDSFLRTGAVEYLDEGIQKVHQATEETTPDDPDRGGRLCQLASQLHDKYERFGGKENLEHAINVARQAVEATPPEDENRPDILNILVVGLGDRYEWAAAMEDLEEAIKMAREIIKATPQGHPKRGAWLDNLGNCLESRYNKEGALEDLEEAIEMAEKAVETTLEGADRPGRLNNLATYLREKYLRTGTTEYLDEAIGIAYEAVQCSPADHHTQDLATYSNHVAICLGERYSRTGRMSDLKEAVSTAEHAVKITPLDHPELARHLDQLGVRLGDRYLRTGDLLDLEGSIGRAREAIKITPPDHPNYPQRSHNLGIRLSDRYLRKRALSDLDEAIKVSRQAIKATDLNHPDLPMYQNHLGEYLGNRFSRTGRMADLDHAVEIIDLALQVTPPEHPDRAERLNNRGNRLMARFSQTMQISDLEEAQKSFIAALYHKPAITRDRISAGRQLLSSRWILNDPEEGYSISKTTAELIPLLCSRSLQNSDKRHVLSIAVGISCDAAAVSLSAGKGPLSAIQFLETGRGVIANTLFERSEISSLRSQRPDLAQLLIESLEKLDSPLSRRKASDTNIYGEAHRLETSQRQEAEHNLPSLLNTIRSQPGFDQFFLPATEAELLEATASGPIVIINVSTHRCDALILQKGGITLLELPNLSQEAINRHVTSLQSLATLAWLWDAVVDPVFETLGFTTPPDNELPHVWWIPTGTLSHFPLHAAGHHLRRNGETALDRVISSYSSSVQAIIHGRQQVSHASADRSNVVLVAMERTPNQAPLDFVSAETEAVLAICEEMKMPQSIPKPQKPSVLSALENCQIFHFAGHGSTHPREPLHSHLLLEDWETDPLTVESLLAINLNSPFLAYLSACGTGQVLNKSSIDESIHLVSAYQLAGFRHVIGTLWNVDDALSVEMARMTYEYLRGAGMADDAVSRGLHHATRVLRDQWIEAELNTISELRDSRWERDAELIIEELEQRPAHWIPYVHYGS